MKILRFVTALAIAASLTACQAVPDSVTTSARTTAAYAFTAWAFIWQPALKLYSSLPYCGAPAVDPCRDRELYRKLYELDAAVTECSRAAVVSLKSDSPDFAAINDCLSTVEKAKVAFAKAGIIKEGADYLGPSTDIADPALRRVGAAGNPDHRRWRWRGEETDRGRS